MISQDFREVAHCGFPFQGDDEDRSQGQSGGALRDPGSRQNRTIVVRRCVLPPLIPVTMIDIRGIGAFENAPRVAGCTNWFHRSTRQPSPRVSPHQTGTRQMRAVLETPTEGGRSERRPWRTL